MKLKITPWSSASFVILVAAIIFAAIARSHSIEISRAMARAAHATMESHTDDPIKSTKTLIALHIHSDNVFGGIGLALAVLGLLTWLLSLAKEKGDASVFPALLLAIYIMLSMMLT